MVHRREGTATGTLFLQPNDDVAKNPLQQQSQKNFDDKLILSPADDSDSLPQPHADFLNPAKSPNKSKTPSPRSTLATPTRKGRQVSQDRSPRKTPTTPAKRALLRGDESNLSQPDPSDATATRKSTITVAQQQNGEKKSEQFPKPLRSGLLRVSRLQSTSLIEVPTIARKRGRRKTICNSLEDVRSVQEPINDFGKFCSAENLAQESHPFPVEKLTCSLPLDKLSLGLMKSLILAKSNNGSLKNHFSDTDLSSEPVSPFANDFVGLSSPQTAAKLLCLYCDKKFTSQKLLCKHTERVHATDGRRLSSRNSIASLSWPSIIAYPGCSFCGNGGHKLAATTGPAAVADDLKALFHHFLDVHSDKYYACKPCELRFPTAEAMEEHSMKKHSKKAEGITSAKLAAAKRATIAGSLASDDLTQPLHVNVDSTERVSPCEDVETEQCSTGTIFTTKTRRQLKEQAMQTRSTLVTRSCQNVLRNNEDTILTRLGVVQNRLPRGRKGTRNRRLVNAEVVKPEQSPNTLAKARSKVGRIVTTSMKDVSDGTPIKTSSNARSEPLSCTFDDDFYETVSLNVRQNLSCHLDGKLEGGPTSPSPLSPVPTIPAIRSTVVRSPLNVDTEIHEATALAAVTAFPTLLTAEQYGSDWNTERKIKRPITRHSWKWKWDCVKKYKYVNEGGKIVKKIKQPIMGLRDLSKLDMWTQLTMRTKHELTRKQTVGVTGIADILEIGEVVREEKRKQIAQLNSILDTRVFPQIVLEQTEQSVVKLEPENDILDVDSQNVTGDPSLQRTAEEEQIPELLQLNRRSHLYYQRKEAIILSGEWARPRCYICFSCGGRFDKLKTLEEHKVSRHPYIYSTHYEIVGRELIEGDLYKHLYIPVKALRGHLEYRQKLKELKSEGDPSTSGGATGNAEEESMDSVNSLSASTTSANGNATVTTMSTMSSLEEHLLAADAASVHAPRRCTKCKRMCNGKLELYRHMLNCSGDYAWRIAQKRKYRYFGVKSRRHARQNFQRLQRRKVIAKKEEGGDNPGSSTGKSPKCNPVRSRPSDADTIRRMLENLPPKRACRQIIPNITKPRCKKFSKNIGLKKLVNASCQKKGKGKGVNVASTTLTAISSNMRRKQRMIARQITRRSGRMAMRLRELKQNSGKMKQTESTIIAKKTLVSDVPEKPVKQITTSVGGNSPKSSEKSPPGEKKNVNNGKKNKKVENVAVDNLSQDVPDSPSSANEKTPKKKSPSKRGQDKSPKSAAEEESPFKAAEKTSSPKQSPKRDSLTVLPTVAEQSTSKPVNLREPLNLVVPSPQIRSPFLQVSPVNKRQRGKKLTDCIAKLQEKLGQPFFEGNETLDTVLSARRQSPPQETQISPTPDIYASSTSNVPNAGPGESATRTPKRKTVTRKIIQKINSEAFVTPKPSLIPPAIKVESEDDAVSSTKSNSRQENISMTSDMCDSIAESDKCDVPIGTTTAVPKDNTLNELNDSAVSSMSADSAVIPNSTPEKRNDRPNLNEIFPTNPSDSVVRKGSRRSERVSSYVPPVLNPPEDYSQGTALNLSLSNFSKSDTNEPNLLQPTVFQPPPPPFVNERPTRKSKICKTPPKLASVETMPLMEEALNLTVSKRRSSLSTSKSSPPFLRDAILLPSRYPGLGNVNFEQPKDFSQYNLPVSNVTYSELERSEPLNLETLSLPVKKEKKKTKSKKTLPNLVRETQNEVLNPEQGRMPDLVISVEPQTPAKKGRGSSKGSKKGKVTPENKDLVATIKQPKLQSIEFSTPTSDFATESHTHQSEIELPTLNRILPSSPFEKNVPTPGGSSVVVNAYTEKSSPDVKRSKGRPRKQTILAQMLFNQDESEKTSKLELSPPAVNVATVESLLAEIPPPVVTSKRGRKPIGRGKNSKKQQDNKLESVLLNSSVELLEESIPNETDKFGGENEKVETNPPLIGTNQVVETQAVNSSISVEAVEKNECPKKNEANIDETSTAVADSSSIPPTVKKKGRPKKTNKKPTPKGSTPELNDVDIMTVANATLSSTEKIVETPSSESLVKSTDSAPSTENQKSSLDLHPTISKNIDPVPAEPPILPLTTNLEVNPPSRQEAKQDFVIPKEDLNQKPGPSSSSSCEKSIFDVLRSVQENVFFHRNEGLTRKYTRKGAVSTRKLNAKPILTDIISSGSAEVAKDDTTVANITLNDGKHLVTAISTSEASIDSANVTCVDNQPPIEYKMPETPKKASNKRRSNRNNRSSIQSLPDNSSICKELDAIVASFLADDEEVTAGPSNFTSNNSQGPTRFSNLENLLLSDKSIPTTSKEQNVSVAIEKQREGEATIDKSKELEADNPTDPTDKEILENNSEQIIVCKELSVTLTKISDIEIEAQLKAAALKKVEDDIEKTSPIKKPEELAEQTSQQPRRGRTRRLSVKPDNVSLTEPINNPETVEPEIIPPVIINEPKLSRKVSRKRKNTEAVTTSMENEASNQPLNVENPSSATESLNACDTLAELPQTSPEEKETDISVTGPKESTTQAPNVSTNESITTSSPMEQDKTAPSKPSTTRRRRKNELAAIVADQLLESFKEVDKSRIDDLKKLENLAYEKSEDLFITGIRLTPLTKRKIVLSDHKEDSNPPKETPKPKNKRKSKSGNTSDMAKESDSDLPTTDPERPLSKTTTTTNPSSKVKPKSFQENLFRNFAESQETPKLNIDPIALPKVGGRNFNLTFGTFRSDAAHEFTFGSQKEGAFNSNFIPGSAETSCSVDSPGDRMQEDSSLKAPTETSNSKSSLHRKMKKKMNRFKKEKKAENENINELRTGLESFTFGKNTFQQFGKGVFGSVGFLGLFTPNNKDKPTPRLLSSSMPSLPNSDPEISRFDKREEELRKPFLRPSILSVVLSQDTAAKKASRDPRLNKSKLKVSDKDDAKASQSLQDLSTTPDLPDTFIKPKTATGLRSKRGATKSIPPVNCASIENNEEEDDDNCLSAIAQSVNNRIMSEEEEFSQADELEVNLSSDPAKKQNLSRPESVLDDQRTLDMALEDENTNTELIDMDLEDDMSVYTSFSQDASCFASGKSRFGHRRRRRRSILLARRPKKSIPDPNQPEQAYDCTICNKTFGKATALAKHQQTFTHVQKLSEYEYLNKLNEPKSKDTSEEAISPPKETFTSTPKKVDVPTEPSEKLSQPTVREEVDHIPSRRQEQSLHTADEAEIDNTPPAEVPTQPPPMPAHPPTPEVVPPKITNTPVLTAEIEPISSPEHAETTYERYQTSSRIALSQEERLFYECCNMLKGSETPMVERTYPVVPTTTTYPTYDVPNKPVTPKSSERFSYLGSEVTGNFQHGTAYTVKSPMSQSRTSPRYAYPKIDANQFSDISSDSNPALTRTQHPHIALQPGAECHPIGDANPAANKLPFYDQTAISPMRQAFSGEQHLQHHQGGGVGGGHAYHHADGGATYYGAGDEGGRPIPLELGDSATVLTARTYIADQRSKVGYVGGSLAGYSNVVMEADRTGVLLGSEQPLTSPLHSNSSQESNTNITACRMRTKAAMKGYDNFKVSIPTMGLDIQQALERSPHGGCKLTALAEIALGSEAPITPPRYHPHSAPSTPHTPLQDEIYDKQLLQHHQQQLQHHQKSKPDINEKFAKKYQELIMNNIKPVATKTVKKKEVCDNSTTPKSGYKAKSRRKCGAERGGATTAGDFASSKLTENNIVVEKPPKDIYEFEEESQEPIDKDAGRGSPSKGRNPIVIPERPFKNIGSEDQNTIKFHKPEEIAAQNEDESQMSTTSYSDRDDFNYGSMSDGGGEDSEKEEEEEEPKSSDSDSCASAQTAKTHKCLIMGRIFGNANKNRPIEHTEKSAPAAPITGPKKKIPRQELNDMFDRLRKDGGRSESLANKNQSRDTSVEKKETVKGARTARASRAAERAKRPITTTKSTPPKAAVAAEPPAKRESQRTSRSADPYYPREIAKLQAELGMSAEEIAELIGEGKRKSQRKCAINRPRTVVDTWSSDEYEDFLSTKDVIAFIEEQERRSKKKKTTNKTDVKKKNDNKNESTSAEHKESSKENENETSTAQSNKKQVGVKPTNGAGSVTSKQEKEKSEKLTPVMTAKDKKPQRVVDRLMQRFNKSRGGPKKTDSKSGLQAAIESEQPTKPTESTKPQSNVSKTSAKDASPIISALVEDPSDTQSSKKQPTLSVKPRLKSRRHTDNDSESDFENELRRRKSSTVKRTTSKICKRRKTIAFKEEHNDMTSDSKYAPKPKQSANLKTDQSAVVSTPPAAATTATPTATTPAKPSQQNSPATVRPLARRKRVASEMLYYWSSSSSDEEFGRIETNEVDITQKDEYLPKHGWIVGDSHKKLVTLLATAKGKKMTDLKEPATTARKKS